MQKTYISPRSGNDKYFRINLLYLLMFLLIFTSCKIIKKTGQQENKVPERNQIEYQGSFVEAEKQKMLGNLSEATALLLKCLELYPSSDATYYELANVHSFQNDFPAAAKYAEKAVELNPDNIWYQMLLGRLYRTNNNPEKSAAVFKKLVKKYPEKSDLYFELAELYTVTGQYTEAIKVYDMIEEKFGVTESLVLEKQKLYQDMDKPAKAITEIEKLVRTFPDESRFYGILAEFYTAAKQYDKAIETYNKLLEFDPDNGMAHLSLADFYRQTKNFEKWFAELKIAFASQDVPVDTKVNILSSVFAFTGNSTELNEKGYTLMNILLETHPRDIKVHALYSDYLIRNNQISEARDELRYIISEEKKNFAVCEQLFLTEIDLNDNKALYEESREAMDYFPNQPSVFLFNGTAAYFLKKYDESVKTLNAGLDLVIDNDKLKVQFLMYLGESFNKLKNYIESDAAFDKLLKIEPDNVSVLNNYAYYLSLRGDSLEKAARMAEKCIAAQPKSSSYLDTYAWALYRMNNFDKARTYIEKALENNGTENPVIVEHYGDILFKLGDRERAIEEWKKATSLGEGSEYLKEKVKTGKLI